MPIQTAIDSINNNQGSPYGFKNRIINGQMQIAQRATSNTITAASTIAAGYSTVDRFYVYCTGANVTAAQVAGSGAIKNRLQITGAASVTAVGIGQRIEQLNSYDMAGSTATLSADLAISATLTTVTWTASYANTADTFGTLASPTITQIATGTFTVSATVTNFNAQITIPAAATTGIQVVFTVGALTSGLTWTVGNVQLEKGSTATSFDYRPYGTELALCQRYCYAQNKLVTNNYYAFGTAFATGATTGQLGTPFPVSLRSNPSATYSAANLFFLDSMVSSSAGFTAIVADQVGNNYGYSSFTGGTGSTAGYSGRWLANNASAAWVIWSAEL
jgi:hypothetical protein